MQRVMYLTMPKKLSNTMSQSDKDYWTKQQCPFQSLGCLKEGTYLSGLISITSWQKKIKNIHNLYINHISFLIPKIIATYILERVNKKDAEICE